MGLIELIDFLEATSDRIDYVKFTTPQVIYSPDEWIKKKIKAYKQKMLFPFWTTHILNMHIKIIL